MIFQLLLKVFKPTYNYMAHDLEHVFQKMTLINCDKNKHQADCNNYIYGRSLKIYIHVCNK